MPSLLEVRAAPNVWNGKQRMVAEARRDARGHGAGRGFRIDGLERGVAGVYRLQRFRRAIVDVQADAGGIRQRGKIQHQATQNLGGRGGADHLLAQRVEQPHLLSQRRHAALAEPPDGRQRASQNQRGQQHGRLNRPTAFQHGHRGRARDQDLEVSIIGRQGTVLAGDSGDPDAIAQAKAAQFRAGVAPRAGQKHVQLVAARAHQRADPRRHSCPRR